MLKDFGDDRKVRWMCRTVKELRESDVKTGLYVLSTSSTYPNLQSLSLQYRIRPKGKVGGREIFMLGREFDAVQPVGTVECGSFRLPCFLTSGTHREISHSSRSCDSL